MVEQGGPLLPGQDWPGSAGAVTRTVGLGRGRDGSLLSFLPLAQNRKGNGAEQEAGQARFAET